MGHHVHGADAQHGAVHVEAVKHAVHVVVFVLPIEKNLLLAVFLQVVADGDEKTRCTTGRVANNLVGFRFRQFHHHADDVAGRAKLTVDARRGNLGEQVFVYIATGIRRFELCHLLVDAVHGRDDFVEHQGRRNLEDGVPHVSGIGAFFVAVQFLDEGENPFLHGAVHLRGGEVVKDAPFELVAVNAARIDPYLSGEDALEGDAEHGGFARAKVVRFIQIVNEHEIGHLLDDIQRVG